MRQGKVTGVNQRFYCEKEKFLLRLSSLEAHSHKIINMGTVTFEVELAVVKQASRCHTDFNSRNVFKTTHNIENKLNFYLYEIVKIN